jgi:hypothetical protein
MMEMVNVPGIHDSELRRIEIPGDKTLSLTFETVGKELRSIVLEGVEDFRCDALLAGNIIADFWKIERPTIEDLARVACREISLKDSRSLSQREREFLCRRQAAVQQGELLFLRLESSYGCVMDALCRSYRVA